MRYGDIIREQPEEFNFTATLKQSDGSNLPDGTYGIVEVSGGEETGGLFRLFPCVGEFFSYCFRRSVSCCHHRNAFDAVPGVVFICIPSVIDDSIFP